VSNELKVYPSGFLGSAAVAHTEPLDLKTVKHRLFDPSAVTNLQGHTANLEVTSLWQDVTSGDRGVNEFAFHEKVLRCAKAAFGTVTIADWIRSQAASPTYTEHHHEWIDDTLRYVLGCTPRQYTYNVWYGLLTVGASDRSKLDSVEVRRWFGEFGPYKAMSMVEFIGQWCQQPRGIQDLLESMFLLFGTR
jgi:hypothetical protein